MWWVYHVFRQPICKCNCRSVSNHCIVPCPSEAPDEPHIPTLTKLCDFEFSATSVRPICQLGARKTTSRPQKWAILRVELCGRWEAGKIPICLRFTDIFPLYFHWYFQGASLAKVSRPHRPGLLCFPPFRSPGQEFKASGTIAVVVQRFVKAKLQLNEAADSWVRRAKGVQLLLADFDFFFFDFLTLQLSEGCARKQYPSRRYYILQKKTGLLTRLISWMF